MIGIIEKDFKSFRHMTCCLSLPTFASVISLISNFVFEDKNTACNCLPFILFKISNACDELGVFFHGICS